ncbi:tubby C-terminal-like domain-containing protein [Artemisia annua]|uniref:Tubby C-terminal-like domain-containing protein n=1 Tax=Artemisia annua TaxID=35608 RepID=A0A2U1KYD6_ARTAN|nr:tubby C-terminal-like domain-containing protein [Artemisia annua]
MTKVYPNAVVPLAQQPPVSVGTGAATQSPLVLTIWKKSLLFNCHGFTVFDSNGNLVYRVDNYNSGTKPEIVLMDASGRSLLTIRRKRLSLMENWLIYDGETTVNPLMAVTKHVNLRKSKSMAHVTVAGSREKYDIEGSYRHRSCVVYGEKRRCVAEIKRKEAVGGVTFGGDVFRLFVQPEIDPSVAMAILVVLDQMFQ